LITTPRLKSDQAKKRAGTVRRAGLSLLHRLKLVDQFVECAIAKR
jgi:hypothetical protein